MPDSLIYESNKSKIYLQENNGEKPLVLKVLNLEYPTPFEIDQFYNEYSIIETNIISNVSKNEYFPTRRRVNIIRIKAIAIPRTKP